MYFFGTYPGSNCFSTFKVKHIPFTKHRRKKFQNLIYPGQLMFKDIKMQLVQIQKDPPISHKQFITSVREQTKQYGNCLLTEINRSGKKRE